MRNEHGQPISPHFHARRLIGRSADELIGICKGVLSDGVIASGEAEFLLRWMAGNAAYVNQWPFDHLYSRLAEMLQDGHLDAEEERELLQILSEIASPGLSDTGETAPNELLCDTPVPDIIVDTRTICLTGRFVSGARREIEERIEAKGGRLASSISRRVHYLVIGSHGSRDWLMSTHGTKILAAADLKSEGHAIAVIAERNFIAHL